ncbi:MAG: ribosome silencing factor [Parvularculaceae bacterium]
MEAELSFGPTAVANGGPLKVVGAPGGASGIGADGAPGASPDENSDEIGGELAAIAPDRRGGRVLEIVAAELAEDKAENVVTIDLAGKSDIADAMVIASGRSQRHVGAMADKIARRLKTAGLGSVRSEGQPACDWVLIDAGDVIVHLFRPEVREFYNLERIWSEAAHAPAVSVANATRT